MAIRWFGIIEPFNGYGIDGSDHSIAGSGGARRPDGGRAVISHRLWRAEEDGRLSASFGAPGPYITTDGPGTRSLSAIDRGRSYLLGKPGAFFRGGRPYDAPRAGGPCPRAERGKTPGSAGISGIRSDLFRGAIRGAAGTGRSAHAAGGMGRPTEPGGRTPLLRRSYRRRGGAGAGGFRPHRETGVDHGQSLAIRGTLARGAWRRHDGTTVTAERWEQIKSVFVSALDLSGDDRQRFLERLAIADSEICGEVGRLRSEERSGGKEG